MDLNNDSTITMVDRACRILNLLWLAREPLGVSQISTALDIPKAAVYRILCTLKNWDYVKKNEQSNRFTMGPAFIQYGTKVTSETDIVTISSKYIDKLAQVTGESISLASLYNNFSLTLHNARGDDFYLVARLIPISPLNCSASGKIFLSEFTPEKLKEYFESDYPQKRTIKTNMDPEVYLEEKKRYLEEGFFYDNEEYEYGLMCIGLPIRRTKNKITAAISLSGPYSRLEHKGFEVLKKALTETRDAIESEADIYDMQK